MLSLEILIEVTLALRVIAIYGFNRAVVLCFITATSTVAGVGIWGETKYEEHTDLREEPGLPGCHAAFSRAAAIRAYFSPRD
ncbi:hypothetical protein FB45DRAFT_1030431 [Roridomyces roridus]|uniref:Uncharacterized protein n=1 Tax=Roridomyces roridus TaxID=1738132 RepID=A0AAD7BNI0_9AGAR|nr:hypothetical protein FB45DRAFT_1030431 [Roridomyces roridus]